MKTTLLFLVGLITLCNPEIGRISCQWPSVEKMMKSHYLPSLEVKVHPPDEYQPKVQAEISKLEADREKAERKLMQTLEKDYNSELNEAATKISKVIKDALSVFEDKNLLNKSAEYAINPPMIMVTKAKEVSANQPSFKEIADFSMNNIQKDTLEALVEDDNRLEKLRNAKVSISLGDGLEKPKKNYLENNSNEKINFIEKHSNANVLNTNTNNINHINNTNNVNHINHSNSSKSLLNNDVLSDGPLDLSSLESDNPFSSFLELKQEGKYSKPISVIMKLPAEPDGKIKSDIDKMEKERADHEKKMFTKAKEEFKLITQITIKELQMNLDHELIPFFVVSKNDLSGLKGIIAKNFPKKGDKGRFLQIDESEINSKYSNQYGDSDFSSKDSLIDFNKYTYNKILDLFSNKGDGVDKYEKESEKNYEDITSGIQNKYKLNLDSSESIEKLNTNSNTNTNTDNRNVNLHSMDKFISSQFDKEEAKREEYLNKSRSKYSSEKTDSKSELKLPYATIDEKVDSSNQNKEDSVSFSLNSCMEMQKKFSGLELNCNSLDKDYQEVSSFLETHNSIYLHNKLETNNKLSIKSKGKSNLRGGDEDFINVKFSAAEDSYPTIEKLVAQMMTRRDLAEKFERLKILEFETNLQKAENEMIQDILHDSLYKVMAKYGPAIEGMKQHIK